MSLLEVPAVRLYKPMMYPWAYEAWLQQCKIRWLPEEIPMGEDINDYHNKLTVPERNLLTQIFRFFTQSDIEVRGAYIEHYLNIFQPTEVLMMLTEFASVENIHIAAYAHLVDTLGLPESEYSAFLEYQVMRDKYDYMHQFKHGDVTSLTQTMAAFGAFTEGLQLFASFAILLNFPRFNLMKGMGQIISWSSRDETLHSMSAIRLFHTLVDENPGVWTRELRESILGVCKRVVTMEDAFIDLAFNLGDVRGLSADDMKGYIRYIADRRLLQLKMRPEYDVSDNPLPWMDDMLNGVEHVNFFEQKSTNYSKASTTGTWDEAWETLPLTPYARQHDYVS